MTVRDVYAAARASGAVLRRVDHRRDSLQEIFLRAMEDGRAGA
jgi:hypothetical protein